MNGTVNVAADGVTIENCDIRGDAYNAPTGPRRMVNTDGAMGTLVRYNTIHATFNNEFFNAIGDRNVVAEFNDISHVTDGFAPGRAPAPRT